MEGYPAHLTFLSCTLFSAAPTFFLFKNPAIAYLCFPPKVMVVVAQW
jgi:hypothetical protein